MVKVHGTVPNAQKVGRVYINQYMITWLVVPTPLKNIRQNGSFSQIGMKIQKNIFETTTLDDVPVPSTVTLLIFLDVSWIQGPWGKALPIRGSWALKVEGYDG